MKHVIKPRLWETMWSARQAVLYLLLNGEQLREAEELAISIEADNAGWVKVPKSSLQQDQVLRVVAPNLSHVLSRLDDQMREYKLPSDFAWPPALWLRSFKVSKFHIQPHAMPELERWQVSTEAKGTYFLYTYRNTRSGKFAGPSHEPTGKLGRTALELFSAVLPNKIANHTHTLEWKVECHKTIAGRMSTSKSAHIKVVEPKKTKMLKEPRIEDVKSKETATFKPRKRRNINALRTQYGIGCVDAVEAALYAHSKKKSSNIAEGSGDNRPYSTQLSKSDLIDFLRSNFDAVGLCSVSTLKPVLGHYVQTPRGRPPTLVELSERNHQMVKKAQRKSR